MFLLSSFFSTFFWFMILNRKLPFFINSLTLDVIQLFVLSRLVTMIFISCINMIVVLNHSFNRLPTITEPCT
jgi:hypothetical protein